MLCKLKWKDIPVGTKVLLAAELILAVFLSLIFM